MAIELFQGECADVMSHIDDNSVDAMVTDPPYGLSFMNKRWDYDVPSIRKWKECLRILKPGAHALIFSGSRTQHRMAINIENAGFILKDTIMWIYGSGFPKSLDIEKYVPDEYKILWKGYGTALKPSYEPIILAMKPNDGTYAYNALNHDIAGINIDDCRIKSIDDQLQKKFDSVKNCGDRKNNIYGNDSRKRISECHNLGRFPANIIHDGSEEVVSLFPTSSITGNRSDESKNKNVENTKWLSTNHKSIEYVDNGSAARFFYCAKASKSERNIGVEAINGNYHPTVKPLSLMKYLCNMVTMPNGSLIIDPFMGSGTTGMACISTGNSFIGIEKEVEYFKIASKRIKSITYHQLNF